MDKQVVLDFQNAMQWDMSHLPLMTQHYTVKMVQEDIVITPNDREVSFHQIVVTSRGKVEIWWKAPYKIEKTSTVDYRTGRDAAAAVTQFMTDARDAFRAFIPKSACPPEVVAAIDELMHCDGMLTITDMARTGTHNIVADDEGIHITPISPNAVYRQILVTNDRKVLIFWKAGYLEAINKWGNKVTYATAQGAARCVKYWIDTADQATIFLIENYGAPPP